MNELKVRCGASVGWVNSSWPYACLEVDSEKMKLKVSLIGQYEFSKEQIVSIKKHVFIPVLGWGIRIEHNIESYPQRIIVLTLGDPNKLLEKIEKTGFLPCGQLSQQILLRRKGFPVKTLPIVIVVMIWNIIILAEKKMSLEQTTGKPSFIIILAFFLIFSTSIAIKNNKIFANVFLKPDRFMGEINPVLNLLSLVTGILFFIFLIIKLDILK